MMVSVIVTVKNEGPALHPLLESLCAQTRPPDEVVFCDGGSNDDTLDILESYRPFLPLRIVHADGSNISQGRNKAIASAAGPIIAATDAGVILNPDWLAELARPIEEHGAVVVSGWFEADARTQFEVAMGATVLPELSDVKADDFLPSSRSVAFIKQAWREVGGYPEWLDYSEDLIFDLALKQRYGQFAFAPRAVAHFRPRGDIGAFARQYYLYARGDGKADLWPKRHAIRYLTYLVGLPLIASLIRAGRASGWLMLLLGGAVYCRRPAQRLWPRTNGWPQAERTRALALIPLIRLVGDLAKMIGYPVGRYWRYKNRPPG
ncbi:MAG: glycosyltransferase [Chloroflexota bacterium]|nr:MAG: glycosyltransferase [Chloroflexota bacterium]